MRLYAFGICLVLSSCGYCYTLVLSPPIGFTKDRLGDIDIINVTAISNWPDCQNSTLSRINSMHLLLPMHITSTSTCTPHEQVYMLHEISYKVAEMIRQKPILAILSLNLVRHPIHCIREITYKWLDI